MSENECYELIGSYKQGCIFMCGFVSLPYRIWLIETSFQGIKCNQSKDS